LYNLDKFEIKELLAMTNRTTPNDIAKSLNNIVSADTIRNWVDAGILHAEKDFRGWRWFPNPEKTVRHVKQLLYSKIVDE
jgi:hypothetical protein